MTPEEKKEYYRLYRINNREKINQHKKKYADNNPDKIKESKQKYIENNPDKDSIYYQQNKEVFLSKQKIYRKLNHVNIALKSKKYRDENIENSKKYAKEYYLKNSDKLKDKAKSYYTDNKSAITIQKRNYSAIKRKTDPVYKLKELVKTSIRQAFKKVGKQKNNRTEIILGCSIDEFRQHLESKFEIWMTWENHGLYNGTENYGWDIDHIIPLKTTMTEDDVITLCHFTNLQPLCSYINRDVKRSNLVL